MCIQSPWKETYFKQILGQYGKLKYLNTFISYLRYSKTLTKTIELPGMFKNRPGQTLDAEMLCSATAYLCLHGYVRILRNWASAWENLPSDLCNQGRRRSVCMCTVFTDHTLFTAFRLYKESLPYLLDVQAELFKESLPYSLDLPADLCLCWSYCRFVMHWLKYSASHNVRR